MITKRFSLLMIVVGFLFTGLLMNCSDSTSSPINFPPDSLKYYIADGVYHNQVPQGNTGFMVLTLNLGTFLIERHDNDNFPPNFDEYLKGTVDYDTNTLFPTHVKMNAPRQWFTRQEALDFGADPAVLAEQMPEKIVITMTSEITGTFLGQTFTKQP